ncbi:MAG TPA: cation:proton antiporter [Acidimicrobiales bacterium]|nr:cation:proton antiporter [Acidimicrobiales bacterium]
MDIAEILRDILVVLVAAKVAAELAERAGIPAVVGEIVAGILVGPSVLGLVGDGDQVLHVLGEIGVILLLLDVGLEMDLVELGRVGRASLLVATVGVITPLLLGLGAMELFVGDDFNTSLFVGAALTATSVGITARVFSDLRAMATTEARVVLGAAVADDVMGLVVLTVVVRLVTEGSVSLLSVAGIVAGAAAFLLVGTVVGIRLAPPLFRSVARLSRSTGTMVALALAFTLAFAELADVAKLAPIVGAFVAGIALNRSDQAGRIRRELTPVGHLFIPVFFLQIGINADIASLTRLGVLRDAALLLAVAVVGKLVSPLGAAGTPGDKPLIGLGMLPRGEVGLIFATIGLQSGVLDDDLYAALLLVVLVTTLATPKLLQMRYSRLRKAASAGATPADTAPPTGGWLVISDDEVHLQARPPGARALAVALEAAVAVGRNRPGTDLLDWLAQLPDEPLAWDAATRELLIDVIERGNSRGWRFLETTGVLDQCLPELAAALRRRHDEPFTIDPLQSYRFSAMERLRRLDADDPLALEIRALEGMNRLFLAALLTEGLDDERDPAATADRLLDRLGFPADERRSVGDLVRDRDLLWSAARQPGALGEEKVLQLASHLETPEQARLLYTLSALRDQGRERWETARLRDLHELIQAALHHPELTGSEARGLADLRRLEAAALVADQPDVIERLGRAPLSYILRQPAHTIARQAKLVHPLPAKREVRARTGDAGADRWWVDVAARDRPGLLAAVTAVLSEAGLAVSDAVVATWDDGAAIESFIVRGVARPDPASLADAIEDRFGARPRSAPLPDVEITFDNDASPWHTVAEMRSPDRPGLLRDVATALEAARVDVLAASLTAEDELVIDSFDLTTRNGLKLDDRHMEAVRRFVHTGVPPTRRRFRHALRRRQWESHPASRASSSAKNVRG